MNIRCFSALVKKERKQMLREPSNIIIGIIFPIMLLLIFGYGLNMDVKNIPLAIVVHENSAIGNSIIEHFKNSEYFKVTIFNSSKEGEKAVKELVKAGAYLYAACREHQQRIDYHDKEPAQLILAERDRHGYVCDGNQQLCERT